MFAYFYMANLISFRFFQTRKFLYPWKSIFFACLLHRSNINFYDRVKGLFRLCFPYDEKPRKNWRDFFLVRSNKSIIFWNEMFHSFLILTFRVKKLNSAMIRCNFIWIQWMNGVQILTIILILLKKVSLQ